MNAALRNVKAINATEMAVGVREYLCADRVVQSRGIITQFNHSCPYDDLSVILGRFFLTRW